MNKKFQQIPPEERHSKNDIIVTQRLIKAGNILGIRFLDHVIFNKKTYYSFKEHAVIEELN